MVYFNSINKQESYVELTTKDGEKHIIPANSIIYVEDGSGMVSIKNTASRKTIGLISEEAYHKNPDEPEHYKVFGYLTDGSFYVVPEGGFNLFEYEVSQYKATMVSAKIGSGVTSIGNSVFSNCASLTSVTMSDGVTSSLRGVMSYSSVQVLYVSCEQFDRNKNDSIVQCMLTPKPNYECNLIKTYSKTMTDGTKIDCYTPLIAYVVQLSCIDSEIVTTLDIYQDIDLSLGHNMRVPANINVYSENAKISENSLYIKPSGLKEGIKNLYFKYTYNTFNEDIIIPSTVETLELYFKMTHPCNVPPKNIIMKSTVPPDLKNITITYSNSSSDCPSTIRNIMIYVPDESVDAYKAASGWSNVADRIKPISEYYGE